MHPVLIISNSTEDISRIKAAFDGGQHIDTAGDFSLASDLTVQTRYGLVFIDLELLSDTCENHPPAMDLKIILNQFAYGEVVIMATGNHIRKAVDYIKQGVGDYITRPVSTDEVRLLIEKTKASALRRSELDFLRDQFWKSEALEVAQTKSPVMANVFKKIRSVAATKTTVLMTGETGTGKSLLAKLIHQHSNRSKAQFISVHCGAIPDTLLESELFGHEKGAFTGALRKKPGKFEVAHGGTIFLDEIGTLTPQAQIKLLQVLQDGTFSHVGGEDTIHTNARVIAATNADLKAMSDSGEFRKDLYYRLNVFPIHIPSLRERIEDLPQLMHSFLTRLNREFQKSIDSIHPSVEQGLSQYHWPGNVRELENLMERAYILETESVLTIEGFPPDLFGQGTAVSAFPIQAHLPLAEARRRVIDDFERRYLEELLLRNKGRISPSAEEAGISTSPASQADDRAWDLKRGL